MIARAALSILLFQFMFVPSFSAQFPTKTDTAPLLWDDKPAVNWMSQAYPMGNGRVGGMVFGGVRHEQIQFNEISLWTGDEHETGAYQAFGDIHVDLHHATDAIPAGYRRELDLSRAVQQISYADGGVAYSRTYFCNHPDNVMVLHYTADKKGSYRATIRFTDAHGATTAANGASLTIAGTLDNGMAYQADLVARIHGGTVTVAADTAGGQLLEIANADGFTLILTAATDYSNKREDGWKGQVPSLTVKKTQEAVRNTSYDALLKRHIQDYQHLFGRVSLYLGNTPATQAERPTRKRLEDYPGGNDPQLESLLFHYGRYLLISASRPGSLPANLQGLWNNSNTPPWRSDYHSNINVQMNYWLAEPTNLSECHLPYLDYIHSLRGVKKEHTQAEYPGVRGWTVRTENNIFGGQSFSWNTPGSAWFMQAVWEHYAFTRDTSYLRDFAYPLIKEIVEFWDDHLKRREDGTVVAPMGWSPEHGPVEDGVSHDQQIVWDLFTNYIEAADILATDGAYRRHIASLRDSLLPPRIGRWGQLQEWETDRDDPNDQHRHVSHLFGLHPGRQFSLLETPRLAEAAKTSLQARGDASTGWSMAWKINFWARLHDGDHAYRILRNFLTLVGNDGVDYDQGGGVYANLLCSHPPFQIDGNLGYVAGISEMLVQSQTGTIEVLSALPDAWSSGRVQGLRARGNFEITDLQWVDGRVTELVITAHSGGTCRIRTPHAVTDGKNTADSFTVETHPGRRYRFALP